MIQAANCPQKAMRDINYDQGQNSHMLTSATNAQSLSVEPKLALNAFDRR